MGAVSQVDTLNSAALSSVAIGHMCNTALKIFSFLSGWAGNVKTGAYESTWPALGSLLTHATMATLVWMSTMHSTVKSTPIMKEAKQGMQKQM